MTRADTSIADSASSQMHPTPSDEGRSLAAQRYGLSSRFVPDGNVSYNSVTMAEWSVMYTSDAREDLRKMRRVHLSRIRDAIERGLGHEPDVVTKNRKPLADLSSPLSEERAVWELRVGPHRVFNDVDPEEQKVTVLWVRRKPPHSTTEGVLP
jgi:mRNA-degrading endonuclease RelE of RelBE toxin-antitoxin system